jgi:hypothetical protein
MSHKEILVLGHQPSLSFGPQLSNLERVALGTIDESKSVPPAHRRGMPQDGKTAGTIQSQHLGEYSAVFPSPLVPWSGGPAAGCNASHTITGAGAARQQRTCSVDPATEIAQKARRQISAPTSPPQKQQDALNRKGRWAERRLGNTMGDRGPEPISCRDMQPPLKPPWTHNFVPLTLSKLIIQTSVERAEDETDRNLERIENS